ncbi:Thermostable beta-glucosidase B [Halioglobus japonicus]|nr:Thermostable beta-glucosidase B [Halioglobus japonicus]
MPRVTIQMFYEKIGAERAVIKKKAADIHAQMSLLEKARLLTGNWDLFRFIWLSYVKKLGSIYNARPIPTFGCKRLGVPGIGFSDGPRGVTMGFASCFPVSIARGASFDRNLEREVGDVIGREVRAFKGGNFFAGICINLLRHPAWGRAQETYGEDPYHVGEFGLALTESVQSHNVMGCVKHYAMNNIENSRYRVNVHADERTLHEVYLPHFKKCVVKGGAASLMGAYNLFEGEHICESRKLLTEIAREKWGFEGFHISDFFFGIRDPAKALNAGMDVEMPAPIHYDRNIVAMVERGDIDLAVVDSSVRRVLETTLAFTDNPDQEIYNEKLVSCTRHTALTRKVAEESMALIKNEGDVLPLEKSVKRLLLVGDFARSSNLGDHGSSSIRPRYTVSPMRGLRDYLGDSVELIHCSDSELEKARALASEVDAVLIFAGCNASDEGEFLVPDEAADYSLLTRIYKNAGHHVKAWIAGKLLRFGQHNMVASDEEGKGVGGDRIKLGVRDSQARMIKAIGRINPNTVVNLIAGSMIMTAEWDEQVPAILYNWYAGMEGGNALARILFGEVNPSGKLPFSTPYRESDLPVFSNTENEFRYDYYHGYTLLDKNNIKPMYPFGHGLSYTTFIQSNHTAALMEDRIRVSVDVTNTGHRDGKEVVQVYVGFPGSAVERPRKLLKGFEKVSISAGEKESVTLDVMFEELQYYCCDSGEFVFEPLHYEVYVGNSADNNTLVLLNRIDEP